MAGINEVNALLGKGSEFDGKLTFEGTVRIDGRFKGEIRSEDTLIIGESAHVEADIQVDTVIIYGHVIGNITATNCVELHMPAQLQGNIVTANLQADKGVIFDGNVKMRDLAQAEPTVHAPVTPAAEPLAASQPIEPPVGEHA